MNASSFDERRFKLVVLGTTGVGKTCLTLRFAKGVFDEEQLPTIGAAYLTKKIVLPKTVSEKSSSHSNSNKPGKAEGETVESEKYLVEIWDTAGQERYEAITPLYYRSSEAAIIVFDLTSEYSFTKAKEWLKRLRKERPDPAMPICLAGNKADLYEALLKKQQDAMSQTQSQNTEANEGEASEANTNVASEMISQKRNNDMELVKQEEIDEFVKENKLKYFKTSAKSGENIDEMFKYLAAHLPTKESEKKRSAVLPLGSGQHDSSNANCCQFS